MAGICTFAEPTTFILLSFTYFTYSAISSVGIRFKVASVKASLNPSSVIVL